MPKKYECELSYDQKIKLIETLAHEYQHANDDYITKAITMFEDGLDASYGIETQGRHWQIEYNAQHLSKEAYDRMTHK